MLVPQLSGPLGVWVKSQRNGYRRMKAGKKTPMTPEKALKLKEAGFYFDAEIFKGRNNKYKNNLHATYNKHTEEEKQMHRNSA